MAIPISLADIKSYSIPNIYLIWLSFLCTPHVIMQGLGPGPRILSVIAILLVLHLCGLGMGDVKLLALLFLRLSMQLREPYGIVNCLARSR
jgi:Flp pilus assembly protein protease CpaA